MMMRVLARNPCKTYHYQCTEFSIALTTSNRYSMMGSDARQCVRLPPVVYNTESLPTDSFESLVVEHSFKRLQRCLDDSLRALVAQSARQRSCVSRDVTGSNPDYQIHFTFFCTLSCFVY